MAGIRRLAGIRKLVATEMVENDNDPDTQTNMGGIKRNVYIVTLLGGFMCLGTQQRVPTPVNLLANF